MPPRASGHQTTDQPQTNQACTACQAPLTEPYAHCSNCNADYCLSCGSRHFCTATCQANGCIAGLCVRLVIDGKLSPKWGVPAGMVGRLLEENRGITR